MKDLKVFSKMREKFKKFKLVKVAKYAILTATLIGTVLLTSCVFNHLDTKTEENPKPNVTMQETTTNSNSTTTKPTKPIKKVELNEELQKIIETEIQLTPDVDINFQKYINSINVEYQYSDLFYIDKALEKYNSLTEYNTNSSKFIVNGKINSAKVKEQVIENNKAFFQSYTGTKYSELSSSDFEKIYSYFIETLEYHLEDDNNIDIEQLDNKLENLKIYQTIENENAYVSIDEVSLVVNLSIVKNMQKLYPDIDFLKKNIIHESNHFIQMNSLQERNKEGYATNFGISYEWEELTVNSLNFKWYHEGSAEKLMAEVYGDDMIPITYLENAKAIDSLTLATLLRDDVKENTIEKLSLQSDLNKLFEIFNCKTAEQKKEIIKLMYAHNIIFDVSSAEFNSAYQISTGQKIDYSTKISYEYSLKASIAQTLTKTFYSNLSMKISNEKITLEDIFSLISVFESELSRITWYSTSSRLEYNKDFLINYVNIQNVFFNKISLQVGISTDKLYQAYNAYNGSSLSKSIEISFLDKRENEYLNKVLEERLGSKKSAINEVYEDYKTR